MVRHFSINKLLNNFLNLIKAQLIFTLTDRISAMSAQKHRHATPISSNQVLFIKNERGINAYI